MGAQQRKMGAIAVVGMAFWWPLLRNSIIGFVFSPSLTDHRFSFAALTAFLVCGCLFAAALVIASRVHPTGRRSPRLLVALGLTASLAVLGACWGASTRWAYIATALCAPLLAALYVVLPLAWSRALRQIFGKDAKHLALAIMASYALSFVIGYLSYLPEPWLFIRPILSPFIASSLCAVVCGRASTEEADARTLVAPDAKTLYLLVLFFFLVCSVATGFINTGSVAYQPSSSTFLRDSLNIGVVSGLLVIIAVSRKLERVKIWIITLLGSLLFGGLLIATFFHQSLLASGTGLIQTSKSCFSLMLFLIVILDQRPNLAGSEKAVTILFTLPTLLSTVISYFLVPGIVGALAITYSDFWGTLSLLFGFLLGVLLFGFLSAIVLRFVSNAPQAQGAVPTNNELAHLLGERHSFSAKEEEVLSLMLEGNTYKKIAQIMYVSQSTVQSHVKSMYRKANVHSKQELIDQIDHLRR